MEVASVDASVRTARCDVNHMNNGLIRHFSVKAIECSGAVFLSPLSQILDGALCRAFKVQREFVSPLQVTHLPHVWDLLLPLA